MAKSDEQRRTGGRMNSIIAVTTKQLLPKSVPLRVAKEKIVASRAVKSRKPIKTKLLQARVTDPPPKGEGKVLTQRSL
jgi:hypothetical protein